MVAESPRGNGKRKRASKKIRKSVAAHVGLSPSEEAILRAQLRGTGNGGMSMAVERDDRYVEREKVNPSRHPNARPWPPSEPWVDAQIREIEDVGPDGQPVVYRFHDAKGKAFPPGGKDTGMLLCPFCGRMTPPNAMERFEGPRRSRVRRRDCPDGERLLAGDKHRQPGPCLLCMDHKSERVQKAWGKSPSAAAIQTLRARKVRVEEMELPRESAAAMRREAEYAERTGKVPPENFSMPPQKAPL